MKENTSPTDAEIMFADHMGRFYARRYGFPPMVGRVIGYLAVCDPPSQTISELADALLASRSAITGAVKMLEAMHTISRSRSAGERMDRVQIDLSTPQSMGMDITEYEEVRELMQEGLQVVNDAPLERQAVLLEMSAFAEFLIERIKVMQQEWEAHRAELVAEGKLPDNPRRHGWGRS
jgi:DNA-binding transcriptional regulator GbsR (MarR family)